MIWKIRAAQLFLQTQPDTIYFRNRKKHTTSFPRCVLNQTRLIISNIPYLGRQQTGTYMASQNHKAAQIQGISNKLILKLIQLIEKELHFMRKSGKIIVITSIGKLLGRADYN